MITTTNKQQAGDLSSVEKARIETQAQCLNWVLGVLRVNPGPVAFDKIHEAHCRAWIQFDRYCLEPDRPLTVGDSGSEKAAAKND